MARELAPGVIVVSVDPTNWNGVEWPDHSIAAYELSEADWIEERVFTAARFSSLTVDSQYQFYTTFNVPDINVLTIAIDEDMTGTAQFSFNV
jgi:hypothetical protein